MSDLIARLRAVVERWHDGTRVEMNNAMAWDISDATDKLESLERELAELRAQQPVAWIAVADRLPADLEDVLVHWAPSIPPSVANWNVDRREWCDAFTHNEEDTEPTHWMPLPAKP